MLRVNSLSVDADAPDSADTDKQRWIQTMNFATLLLSSKGYFLTIIRIEIVVLLNVTKIFFTQL
jgi:hypothetical protein